MNAVPDEHVSVDYTDRIPEGWLDSEWTVTDLANGWRVEGVCPQCKGAFTTEVPYSSKSVAARNVHRIIVYCDCKKDHKEQKKDSPKGCGAHGPIEWSD